MSNEHAKHSPLDQFEVSTLVPLRVTDTESIALSFTNAALSMTVSAALVVLCMILGCRRQAMIPGRFQSLVELSYQFVANLMCETIGGEGRRYFPFVFALSSFILFGNLLGMLPYSFAFTSHIVVTFCLAAAVCIGATVLGFVRHKLGFFGFFAPPGAPVWMLPLLVPIEVISYLSRPVSLSVRLFANILAGHTLMEVIAGFVAVLGIFGVLPLTLLVALTGLEVLIAFLQAYVFAILTCLYIKDALHMH